MRFAWTLLRESPESPKSQSSLPALFFGLLVGTHLNADAVPFGADRITDTLYACSDVDALVAEIAAGSHDSRFDLDGNGSVDTTDLDEWLVTAGANNLASGNSYLMGDANLDGAVDVTDWNTWNGTKFTSTAAWCSGDFNADGLVDTTDFNLWNTNKFTSSAILLVPEPRGILAIVIVFILIAIQSTRSSRQPQAYGSIHRRDFALPSMSAAR